MATLFSFSLQLKAQLVIQDDSTYSTLSEMLLANELFESGEPFAEELGYNLDDLDPMVLNSPDSFSYTAGIENYEYSRYLLGTLTGRSGMGLHMMWSPIVMEKAAMQDSTFDGMFTGGMVNGYNEDDMLMMMIANFGMNANQTPPANAFPQFADFAFGNNNLPQTVAADFQMDIGSTRWDRSKMDMTLNPGAMGQSMWKQYFWAQDMLGSFHDENDEGIDADGTNSPDSVGSPNFDPSNNIFYGGNNLDGYIGQVLTAVAINKAKFLISQLAYDGTNLGMVDPATYDPANGIKYFPTKIAVTESMISGLPPQASSFDVVDETSQLFDQLSLLLATSNFKNMMNPNDNSDAAHLAYHEAFDGYPFPADMSVTGMPGPFDLMMGASKVLFLNIMAMHFNSTESTFVDESTLNASSQVEMGSTIKAENAAYIILSLAKFSEEFAGTPLQTMADNALSAQASFILNNFKDASGGYYNSYTIGTGAATSTKTLAANTAIIRGLYAAYMATNDANYLTEANDAYNFLINNYYVPEAMAFRTSLGDNSAVYNPWNLAILSGALREAKLTGNQTDAELIYTRVFKKVYNAMILAEAEQSGETGSDSDGDGVPYIAGGQKPYVYANEGLLEITTSGVSIINNNNIELNLYPNPASDFVSLEMNLQDAGTVQISIYDITGKIVTTKHINSFGGLQTYPISLSSISQGSYIVRVSINNEIKSIKQLIVK